MRVSSCLWSVAALVSGRLLAVFGAAWFLNTFYFLRSWLPAVSHHKSRDLLVPFCCPL